MRRFFSLIHETVRFCRRRCTLVVPASVVLVVGVVIGVLVAERPLSSSPKEYPHGESTTRPNMGRQPDPARIEDTLARFLYDWPETGNRDRAAMARFFGFFRYEPAMKALRKEASYLHGEAAVASLHALAAMGDVQSVPIFREVIRSSRDCDAIRTAAAALGHWRDHGSYSTLTLALLEPECDGEVVVEVVQAILRIRHPFVEELLFHVHQTTTSSTVRLASAAALSKIVTGPRRRGVEQTLRTALDETLVSVASEPGKREQELMLSLYGMGRFTAGSCREAREAAVEAFEGSTGTTRQVIGRAILFGGLPCLHLSYKKNQPLLGALLKAADDPELSMEVVEQLTSTTFLPLASGRPELEMEPAWVDWLVQLATRFTLWDETRSVAQFAQAIERMERFSDHRRSASPSELMAVDRTARVPQAGFPALEREAAGWAPGRDFDEYTFTAGQPEWWPSWIDITIDDGPRPKRLRKYLEIFDEHGVKATFFFIGVNVARYWGSHPDRARELMLSLEKSGHRIGYHSMVHQTGWRRHLQNWSPGQIRDDIELFRQSMEAALGHPWNGVYGRLPGGMGRHLKHVRMGFDLAGLRAHVHWQIQDPTWGPGSRLGDVRALARRLVRKQEPTVILLHEYEGLHHQLNAFIKEVRSEVEKVRKEG